MGAELSLSVNRVEGSENVSANTSQVDVLMQVTVTENTFNQNMDDYGSITIDGTEISIGAVSVPQHSTVTLYSARHTVTHNADGAKTVQVSGAYNINTSSCQWLYASASVMCNTIPRATTPTLSASTIDMGQTLTISCPAASPAFRHNLSYVVGATTVPMATGVESSYAWPVPIGLADKAPSATSLAVAVVCDTYSGGTLIGSKYVYATLTVPASVVPTITDFSLTRINTVDYLVSQGIYVAGYSKVGAHISAAGAYGSTITRATVSVDGKTYNGSDITSDMLQTAGTLSVVANITDSRGRTAAATRTITVQPYARPTISSLTYQRGTYSGGVWTASDTGADVKVTFTLGLSLTAYSNAASLSVAVDGETTQTTTGAAAGAKIYYFTTIGTDVTRKLTVIATDSVGTAATTSADIPTIKVLANVNVDLNSLRLGGVAEDADTFRCSLDAKFDNGVYIRDAAVADFAVGYGCPRYIAWEKTKSGVLHCRLDRPVTLTGSTPTALMGGYSSYIDIDMPVSSATGWTGVASGRLGTGVGFATVVNMTATTVRIYVIGNQNNNSIELTGFDAYGKG